MLKHTILILLLLAAVPAPPAFARTTVEVDRSFGADGTVEAALGPAYGHTAFTAVVPQSDGGLLATRGGMVRRYAADGTLDTAFTPVQVSGRVEAADADGKVLRVFQAEPAGSLERLNPDGTADPTFGVRPNGTLKLSEPAGFRIETIEPLPSGKILVGGSIGAFEPETPDKPGRAYVEQLALARFDHEGRLDPSFGDDGIVKLKSDVGVAAEDLRGLAPGPDEGLEVVASATVPAHQWEPLDQLGSIVVGISPDGRLDTSYGSNGTIRLEDATVTSFHSSPDGSLLMAGNRWGPASGLGGIPSSDVFLSRYTESGRPDSGFGGGDGTSVLDLAEFDLLGSALWEEDGSIWLGGSATETTGSSCLRIPGSCSETPFVAHFSGTGALDPGFAGNGVLRLEQLAYRYGLTFARTGVIALADRSGGGISAAGGSGGTAFIAALSANGALDPGFGNGGIHSEAEAFRSTSQVQALAIERRGRVLVSGTTNADLVDSRPQAALFRYLPDGELDRGFGEGKGYVHLGGEAGGLAFAADGTTFVLTGDPGPGVMKVAADGQIDTSFVKEASASLAMVPEAYRNGRRHRLWLHPVAIEALPGRGLLIAGTAGDNEPRIFALRLRADGSPDRTFGKEGISVLGFGRSLRSTARQVVFQRDGRIVVAGYVRGRPSEERSEAFALMRLRPDGTPDPSFGRRGLVVRRIGRRSFASALAVEGNGRIVVTGKALYGHKQTRELLLRFTARGRLDRGFGHGGMTTAALPSVPGTFFAGPQQILLQPHRVLVLRDNRERQLVVYSRDGRQRQALAAGRSAEPGNRVAWAPSGTAQSDRLLLGWTGPGPPGAIKLQRLRVKGRPADPS